MMKKIKKKFKICKCCGLFESNDTYFKSIPVCSICCSRLIKASKKVILPIDKNFLKILKLVAKKNEKTN